MAGRRGNPTGHSLAVAFNGMRIPGVFHHLSKVDEQKFRQHLGHICHQWHIDCLQNDESAGFLVEIRGQLRDL